MKSVDLIKKLVLNALREASNLDPMAVDGPGSGMLAPSGPGHVPHRMAAAEPREEPIDSDRYDNATRLYKLAFTAREAAETLIVALDDPVYDSAYEQAFKASKALGLVLNELKAQGATVENDEQVVPPPPDQQKYSYKAGGPRDNSPYKGVGANMFTESEKS